MFRHRRTAMIAAPSETIATTATCAEGRALTLEVIHGHLYIPAFHPYAKFAKEYEIAKHCAANAANIMGYDGYHALRAAGLL